MKDLRAACRLAMEVARQGVRADPPMSPPSALRPLLHFARLSAPVYATVIRTVEDDETFRCRVAEAAPGNAEAEVGRVGWLWLSRPDGWQDELAGSLTAESGEPEESSARRLRRERDGAEAAAARARRDLGSSEQARRNFEGQLADEASARRSVEARLTTIQAAHDCLGDERNEAVRKLKDVERALATARRDLRIARVATREVEVELASRPVTQAGSGDAERLVRLDRERSELRRQIGQAVADAAAAAAVLQQSLGIAEAALQPPGDSGGPSRPTGRSATRGTRNRSVRPVRPLPPLPPGMLRSTPEADRLILRSGDVLVVIDGYNLARTAWQGLDPEQERRRTVAMVDEFGARSGTPVRLVFDGVSDVVAPPASRSIQVQFSVSDQTADDAILDLLDALPPEQVVVVVSSDREVIDGARTAGGEAMTSQAFLAAIGR